MRVILHIGAHKTGTTYLQTLFDRHADALSARGIHYPRLYENAAHHVLAAPWLTLWGVAKDYFGEAGVERGWQDLLAGIPADTRILLLSGENFSRLAPEQVDFHDVTRRLARLGPVEIVYVWRDPVEMVQSIWLERFKAGAVGRFEDVLSVALRQEMATGVAVVPDLMWEHLRRFFPPERLHFIEYEWATRHPHGIEGALNDRLGLGLPLAAFGAVEPVRANHSLHPHSAYITHTIESNPGDWCKVAQALAAHFQGWQTGRATLYSRRELTLARQRFTRNERRFSELLAADGLTPDEPARTELSAFQCRDEIREEVWLDLTRRAFFRYWGFDQRG